MQRRFLTFILIAAGIVWTECSGSLFSYCPEPWTIESTSRLKRVWWNPPRVQRHLVTSVRRNGMPSGSIFTAGNHSIIYFAEGFDGSNSTCEVTLTIKVTKCLQISGIGRLNYRCTNGYSTSSRCDFYCPYGYELVGGNPSTTCLENATWLPATFPICRILTCSNLRRPRNSIMRCSSSFIRQGTYCSFTCNVGYQRNGSLSRTCIGKNWTGTHPTCEDHQPPIFYRCKNIRVKADYGSGSTRVYYPAPYAVDQSQVALQLVTGQRPGCRFPIGSNLVEYRAEDVAGNIATCRFYVHVRDNQPPRFQYCPAPIFRYTSAQSPSVVVHYNMPTATDNSTPDHINVTRVLGQSTGSSFSPGVHQIQYSATDDTGNYAECTFYIAVRATSCQMIEERDSLESTCSSTPPYLPGSWCDFRCVEGKILVGSSSRSCTQYGWSGIPATCINDISDDYLNVIDGDSSQPLGTEIPEEYQTEIVTEIISIIHL